MELNKDWFLRRTKERNYQTGFLVKKMKISEKYPKAIGHGDSEDGNKLFQFPTSPILKSLSAEIFEIICFLEKCCYLFSPFNIITLVPTT